MLISVDPAPDPPWPPPPPFSVHCATLPISSSCNPTSSSPAQAPFPPINDALAALAHQVEEIRLKSIELDRALRLSPSKSPACEHNNSNDNNTITSASDDATDVQQDDNLVYSTTYSPPLQSAPFMHHRYSFASKFLALRDDCACAIRSSDACHRAPSSLWIPSALSCTHPSTPSAPTLLARRDKPHVPSYRALASAILAACPLERPGPRPPPDPEPTHLLHLPPAFFSCTLTANSTFCPPSAPDPNLVDIPRAYDLRSGLMLRDNTSLHAHGRPPPAPDPVPILADLSFLSPSRLLGSPQLSLLFAAYRAIGGAQQYHPMSSSVFLTD